MKKGRKLNLSSSFDFLAANQLVHSINIQNISASACSNKYKRVREGGGVGGGILGAVGATDDNLLNIVKNKHFACQTGFPENLRWQRECVHMCVCVCMCVCLVCLLACLCVCLYLCLLCMFC